MSSEDTYYPNPAPYSNPSVSSYGGYFYPPAVPMPMVPAVPMVPAMPAMPYVDPALYYSTMQSFVGANNYYRPPPLNVNGDARTTPEATPEETPPPQPPAPASESSSSSSRGLFRPIDFESASSSTDESEQHGAMAPEPAAVSRSRQGEARPPESHGVTATLIHQRLWDEFHSLGNEMIVTKEGRLGNLLAKNKLLV